MRTSGSLRRRGARALALAAAAALVLTGCGNTADEGGGETTAPEESEQGVSSVNVIAPADPGGGWDQTARTIAQVLTTEGLAENAPVTNIGGAGGTVGLASLATEKDPMTLMITGLVMVGAVETNESATRIEDTTPIARLTEEALVIVVPAESEYQTLEDLVEDIKANGTSVTVTGGSAGGADHILAGMLLTEAGVAPADMGSTLNYIPNSGGGEAVTMLLGNQVSAGISGVGEFVEQIEAGSLRALAVSSEATLDMLPDTPTITEAGYDLVLTNWRGIIAPGGISADDRQALLDVVDAMVATDSWQSELETRGWADAYLSGDEFDSYLATNISEVQQTLKTIGLIE